MHKLRSRACTLNTNLGKAQHIKAAAQIHHKTQGITRVDVRFLVFSIVLFYMCSKSYVPNASLDRSVGKLEEASIEGRKGSVKGQSLYTCYE